ncbi:cell wall protein RBR3 [Oncorhynchus tshawytscha]|uniref:YqaJ viral recombinase domain-containing protein n=1 Tax=Oncorhynchus tshawytscha TaxID=74940 RepID=A0A8C8IPR0_ONCTS|nr:cell wall protein RBR3 [Oncorhynchus tshawytscha]XP_024263132.2 cell wall protein RBR3 [Oncorhynchus tshawytscha]XP_024263133.2 cell wall protein RBR3 [Oncorhynchus tshawytscha]XP_024263134.2 cell wall protein RBR3 [Oncorhynchus tshawytscha]
MTPTKTSQDGSHRDSSVVASVSNSPPTQMHINKGSTLTPSDGSGDSAGWSATVKTPASGTTRATASQARGAKTTDTRYAKKNIPTVRYHPDIIPEKNPEAHQHSHSPVKSSQVRGKPLVSPPRTNQVGGSSVVSPPRTNQIGESSMVSPPRTNQVRGKPLVSPPRTNQVGGSSVVSTPRTNQVGGSSMVSPPRTNQVGGSSVVSPPKPEAMPLGLGQKMEGGVVEAVELQTRGQRENPSWFAWRRNRITASIAHSLAHSRFVTGQSQTPPASYLAAITGRGTNFKTRAMNWGIEREAEAVRRYQSLKSKALGRAVRVQECGLFIDPKRPWLAGSPDGIVEDQRTGQRLLCLEVKCPYKHRLNTVAQACREDPAFCLTIQDLGVGQVRYHLKPDHTYYTQIQCQLAVTGLTQADLVVFTLKETAIIPVTFDPTFWDNTLVKLEMFYTDAVLPYVRDNGLDIPAMRPEE